MSAISSDHLADVFVQVADTLVQPFDLMDFLSSLTSYVAELSNTAAVGLLLADHRDQLQLMAASEESARLLELFVLQNDEGPCRECHATGRLVLVPDLAEGDGGRWPAFTEQAMAAGFRSVAAIPMRHSESIIGALNLFNTRPDPFRPEDLRLVQALAHVATIAILQERAVRESALLTEQLQSALNTRVVIEQAKGVLAQLRSVGVDEAFRLLRTYARNNHLTLSAVARQVVDDPTSHPRLTAG